MPLLTLQAPLPLHTYQTRQDTVTSDANGLISGIAAQAACSSRIC